MKRFLTVLAALALAGAIYVATAPGGQTAGPTAAQFKALKNQVAKLRKDEAKVKKLAQGELLLLSHCMTASVPVNQFGDGSSFTSTLGYTFTQPDLNGGVPFLTTALDVTAANDPGALWITGGTSACGADLTPSLRKLSRLAGIHLGAPGLHSFSAHHR